MVAARAAALGCTYIIPNEIDIVDGVGNYANVRPGDTLCLPAGTRSNIKFINLQGRAGSPITVQNSGGRVRITGTQFMLGGIGIVNSSYLRVTGTGVVSRCGAEYLPDEQECGIEIDHTIKGMNFGTTGSVHDIEIDHIYIHDTTQDILTRGIAIHPPKGQIISGIFIHHNYVTKTSAEGIYIGTEPRGAPFPELGKVENVEVSYNRVERTGFDGIKLKVAINNVKVHHNVVRQVALKHEVNHDAGIQMALSVGEYYNNYVETDLEGIAMGRILENPGTKYYNNIVVGTQVGITTPEADAQIYNNTVVNSKEVGISGKGANAQVFDNIVAGTPERTLEGPATNFFNNLTGSVAATGFVNPAAGNYHLTASSPAVDAGRASGIFPAFDYDGTSRPQGSKTDLGAYEFVSPESELDKVYLPLLVK
jgi:hypothetical protein